MIVSTLIIWRPTLQFIIEIPARKLWILIKKLQSWPSHGKLVDDLHKLNFIFLSLGKNNVKFPI